MKDPPIVSIAVCVPVRNEEAELPRLLGSLARQQGPAFATCLYLDDCTDRSEAVIDKARSEHGLAIAIERSARPSSSNAGRARGAAMALGLQATGAQRGALLLSTDADSAPAPDWVSRCAASLSDVAVAAGRIVRHEPWHPASAAARLEDYLDRLYALRRIVDPVPWEGAAAHHYGAGANLAIRAADYVALGGFASVVRGEDARLLDDASRAGLMVRRDPDMVVTTSARRSGRVPGGLAAMLAELDGGREPVVGDPVVALWQYRGHAAARLGFARGHETMADFARTIGLSTDHCIGVARDCPNAEAFAMRIVPMPPGGRAEMPLAEAEPRLARLEAAALAAAA